MQKQLNQSFKPYPSIQNDNKTKFINKIKNKGFNQQDILWVASQKIHGCNFSIHSTNNQVQYGRRKSFITKPIPLQSHNIDEYFIEKFYNAEVLVQKLHNKLKGIFERIQKIYPQLTSFVIYGEYFGGIWPKGYQGYIQTELKHIQKQIFYTPNHQFMAFDICVRTTSNQFWVEVLEIPKLLQDDIMCVPVFSIGTFDDILKINIKIDSTIPQILGLPKLKNNLIQGMVLRPNLVEPRNQQSRVIIKKKNAQFKEINQQKNVKIEKELHPQVEQPLKKLLKYLNKNRIQNIMTKDPNLTDLKKIQKQILNDIIEDALKDDYDHPLDNKFKQKIEQQLIIQINKQFNEYLKIK